MGLISEAYSAPDRIYTEIGQPEKAAMCCRHRIPEGFPERHAVAYRATGEILEALGDKQRAVEYYECALQKNPKVGVRKRLEALKKALMKATSRGNPAQA